MQYIPGHSVISLRNLSVLIWIRYLWNMFDFVILSSVRNYIKHDGLRSTVCSDMVQSALFDEILGYINEKNITFILSRWEMAELNNTENKKNYIPYCLKIRKFKLTKERAITKCE